MKRVLDGLLIGSTMVAAGACSDSTPPVVPVASVQVTAPSDTVLVGDSLRLVATTLDAQGHPLTGRTILWSSNEVTIAQVSATGTVHGVAPGPVTITATSEGVSGTALIGVRQPILVPVAPQNLQVSNGPVYGELDISWSRVAEATVFNLYWSTTPGVTPQSGTRIVLGTTSYRHENLTAHTTYYYVVTAVSEAGEGPPSVEAHATASSDIAIVTIAPLANGLSDTLLGVFVNPVSRFQVTSVSASVAGRSINLAFQSDTAFPFGGHGPAWVGALSLVGLLRGPQQLTITVVDAFADTAQQIVNFAYDQLPRLVVTEPDDFSVARPSIRVSATCTDDNPAGCSSLDVSACPGGDVCRVIASGKASIDQVLSLDWCDGCSLDLMYLARDSANQGVQMRRHIFVEASVQLSEVASVKGIIFDARPDRILYLDQTTGSRALTVHDRASGNEVVIFNKPTLSTYADHAFLTPTGVLFLADSLYDWEGGSLTTFGKADFLVVKDSFALWLGATLVRRDLIGGVNVTVSDSAANIFDDVSNNGDVVFWSNSYSIYRVRNGVTTRLAFDSTLRDVYPVTDGLNVVYMKSTPCCNNVEYQVAVYDSSEHVLTPLDPAEPSYRAVNGWVAYTKTGPGTGAQIWTRSPAGLEAQATPFGSTSFLEALGPNGEVVVRNSFNGAARRYLVRPDYLTVPRDIGTVLGTPFFQNGVLFVRIGRTLFQVSP